MAVPVRDVVRSVRLIGAAIAGLAAYLLLGSHLVTVTDPRLVGVQAFSQVALPLMVMALLLAVLPLGGLGRRVVALPLTLTLLVGVSRAGAHAAPRWVGAPASGKVLRVMTANLKLGEADAGEVLRAARTADVDLLVLEELTPQLLEGLASLGLRTRFPYAVGVPAPGASGTMAFATRPLTDAKDLGTRHGSWSFHMDGLTIWAVHPAYPYDARWIDDQGRLADLAAASPPDIALGDFNATLDNPPFREILTRGGLRDAAEQAGSGWQPTWPTDGSKGLPFPLAAIDHVLVRGDVRAESTAAHVIHGTDHAALVADLRLG